MELYVNCAGLQTLHLAGTADVAKLIISRLRISKIKLEDDLKAVICFLCFSFDFYLRAIQVIRTERGRKKSQISGRLVPEEAGQLHSISHA